VVKAHGSGPAGSRVVLCWWTDWNTVPKHRASGTLFRVPALHCLLSRADGLDASDSEETQISHLRFDLSSKAKSAPNRAAKIPAEGATYRQSAMGVDRSLDYLPSITWGRWHVDARRSLSLPGPGFSCRTSLLHELECAIGSVEFHGKVTKHLCKVSSFTAAPWDEQRSVGRRA